MKKDKTLIDDIIIAASPILLLVFWQFACTKGLVNYSILPSPTRIVIALKELLEKGTYQKNLWASIRRVIIGYAAGSIAGLLFGVLLGFSRIADDICNILFKVLRSIPVIGLIPLFILWMGIGEETKVMVVALGAFWAVLLNTEQGINSTDKKILEVATLLDKNFLTVFIKIILPSALPSIFTGLRLALSTAWRSVVGAEMIASMVGIGYMITFARSMSAPDIMFVGLLTLGILGLAIDSLLLFLEKKFIKWK